MGRKVPSAPVLWVVISAFEPYVLIREPATRKCRRTCKQCLLYSKLKSIASAKNNLTVKNWAVNACPLHYPPLIRSDVYYSGALFVRNFLSKVKKKLLAPWYYPKPGGTQMSDSATGPTMDILKAANNVVLAAMEGDDGAKVFLLAPQKINHLAAALLMQADNLAAGRPTTEDPNGSARWGKVDSTIIHLAFMQLARVAVHRGGDFFNSPQTAAEVLKCMCLQFQAINVHRARPLEMKASIDAEAKRFEETDPQYVKSVRSATDRLAHENTGRYESQGFAYGPYWSNDPIEQDEPGPLVIADGRCGHQGYKYSTCSICAPEWRRQFEASGEARRRWMARQERKEKQEHEAVAAAQQSIERRKAERAREREAETVV